MAQRGCRGRRRVNEGTRPAESSFARPTLGSHADAGEGDYRWRPRTRTASLGAGLRPSTTPATWPSKEASQRGRQRRTKPVDVAIKRGQLTKPSTKSVDEAGRRGCPRSPYDEAANEGRGRPSNNAFRRGRQLRAVPACAIGGTWVQFRRGCPMLTGVDADDVGGDA